MPLGIGRYSQHSKLTLDALDLDEEVALGVEYDVIFLGKRSVNTPTGDPAIQTAKIVDQVHAEKYAPIGSSIHLKKLRIKVSDQCISITQPPARNKPANLLSIFHFNQITYMSTDIKHERAFVLVCKNAGLYDANVFWCDSKKLAKDLLKTCADAFQIRVSNNDSLRVRASSIGLEVMHLDQPDDLRKDKAIANISKQKDLFENLEPSESRIPLESLARPNDVPVLKGADQNCLLADLAASDHADSKNQVSHELLSFDDNVSCKSENSRSMDELGGIGGAMKRLDSNSSFRSLSMTNVSSNEFAEFGEFQSSPCSNQISSLSLQAKGVHSGFPAPLPLPRLNPANRSSSIPGVNAPSSNSHYAARSSPLIVDHSANMLSSPCTPNENEFGNFQNLLAHQQVTADEDDDDEFTSLATKRIVEPPNHLNARGSEAYVLMSGHNVDSEVDSKLKTSSLPSLSRKAFPKHVSEGENLLQF